MRTRSILAISLLLLGLFQGPAHTAEYLGSYVWSDPDPAFGGFSALEMSPDGATLIALGDRGVLAHATLARSPGAQVIEAVTLTAFHTLSDRHGTPLPAKKADAEGLALGPAGQLYVSFEGVHGIGAITPEGRLLQGKLLRHGDFSAMQDNSSLEALAIDWRGQLYTAPERSGRLLRPFPVYRRDASGGWSQPFAIPRSEDYLLTGMDFGPDGRLYVLERALRGFFFSTRVRSFAVTQTDLSDERLVLQTRIGTHENLEGISLWRDAQGALRLSMIADDNYNLLLRTRIVEYRLP